ncbi:hypothetical protein D1B31_14255 [Neobacillus notoginsengisoli]|uniref:Uncharacterized protein n=1 Tax=Neobacillus notoginsengisoli TaxID=1578198 RepID=A0A417YSY7_9BACI|nr:hypothetical protein [Neobacillus notoginsengisoli]RHW39114.1 hypothetical protein D1B31_14255 [Neobacillus notoginsengisoli]
MKDFHCCATCEHFRAVKKAEGMQYVCSRLGYETKPAYKFNCWSPKAHVQELINKNNKGQAGS